MNALKKMNLAYAISKHYRLDHPEIDTSNGNGNNLMRFRIISSTVKFNLQRFIMEAFTIEKMDGFQQNIKILNSKTEWGCGRLRRLAVVDT